MNSLSEGLKIFQQVGARQSGLYAWYQLGLRSGYLRWRTRSPRSGARHPAALANDLLALPERAALQNLLGDEGLSILKAEADEIVQGKVRLFGGEPVPLHLEPAGPLQHWTRSPKISKDPTSPASEDIKFIWEPARFGWAGCLARAYALSLDERYAESFWKHTERFLAANPAYQGPNWASAQEAALRLVALVFAWQVFCHSSHSTPERADRLAEQIALHAERIPPTLVYARAQNNNHLLTESLGLYTAGLALANHPRAAAWRALGWKWLNRALQSQIAPDGTYIQHSANYHRLALQAALWANALAFHEARPWPERTAARLSWATSWLRALLDPDSGCMPNLGPNDGAYILPLTIQPFADYRPVLQAASQAFLGEAALEAGRWDEMGLWFGLKGLSEKEEFNAENAEKNTRRTRNFPFELRGLRAVSAFSALESKKNQYGSTVLRPVGADSWAYLRAATFHSRPGHADQLHLDLWWRGLNLAQDPGAYLYNAPAPWDNSLTHTAVHNTLTVNDQEQMNRLSRFLYVDWAQAEILSNDPTANRITAQHNGYRRLGLLHRRSVNYQDSHWIIQDDLLSTQPPKRPENKPVKAQLHWLLPDWPYQLLAEKKGFTLRVQSPSGWISLYIHAEGPLLPCLYRAGELLEGKGRAQPTWGWTSPTYSYKIPALALSVSLTALPPIRLTSEWDLSMQYKG